MLEARPTLGGRATAFIDPATGERVDNGQHVLVGGYHETFAFLRRIGTDGDVYLQPDLHVDVIDRKAGRVDAWRARRCRRRCICSPVSSRWTAIGWRDRAGARRACGMDGRRMPIRGRPCASGSMRHGQTPRLIELLWEPLAVAALNQSIDEAAGVRVRRRAAPHVHVRRARDSALGLPLKRARRAVRDSVTRLRRARGGERAGPVRPRESTCDARCRSVRVQGDERVPTRRAVICATAWYSLPAVFRGSAGRAGACRRSAAEATAASPIVTVNLWFDRPVTEHTSSGCRAARCSGCSTSARFFGDDQLAPVARLERRDGAGRTGAIRSSWTWRSTS